uniref:UCH domain-containing protein n=1 Tax=Macrostomum lignano TaxID=282301 RepID=A0A1I8JHC9_9PLAT
SILISPLHPSFGSLAAHKPQQQQQQQQQQPLSVQAVSLFVNFLVDLKKTHSEVSHASDMPKRQECALTISSEHSDLTAASVIWFTCCSQAAAAQQQQQQQQPLSVQAVSLFVNFLVDLKKTPSILISPLHPSFGSLAAHKPQQQQQQQQQQPLSVQAVSLFVNFLVDLKKTHSEVSHASDMPKRQECALTISSEHSDLTRCIRHLVHLLLTKPQQQQQQQQQQQPLSVQAILKSATPATCLRDKNAL